MCSSVKSNRAVKKSQFNFDNELTNEQRLRFAAQANLAQARREERIERNKKRVKKQHTPAKFSILDWFKGYFSW